VKNPDQFHLFEAPVAIKRRRRRPKIDRALAASTPRILRVGNLGAGVQSTTLWAMAEEGELPNPPDAWIFSDTGWEPQHVYDHLAWMMERSTIPIYVVSVGNLRKDIVDGAERGTRIANAPFWVMGKDGRASKLRRTCTKEYKIEPIQKRTRALLAERVGENRFPPYSVEQLIGISTDEASRMSDSRLRYVVHRFPLIELDMSRGDCILWLIEHGYPVPKKSSCIGCPYHDNAYWREMKEERPWEWEDACAFDRAIRTGLRGVGGTRGLSKSGEAYLHRSLVPLSEVDLSPTNERGEPNLFEEDCTGHCGVFL
jgi:hypothetical protein